MNDDTENSLERRKLEPDFELHPARTAWALFKEGQRRSKATTIKPEQRVPLLLVVCFFMLVGIGLLGACLHVTQDVLEFKAIAENSTGRVIRIEEHYTAGSKRTYHPVLRFTLSDGEQVEFTSSTTWAWGPEVGDEVDILYNPNNSAEDARINTPEALWFLPGLLGIMGLVCALLPLKLLGDVIRSFRS